MLSTHKFLLTVLLTALLSVISHKVYGNCPTGTVELPATTVLKHTESVLISENSLSDSFFGHIILSMAYQRDKEMSRLIKKMSRVDTLTLTTLAGVSGLNLSQSIINLNTIHSGTSSATAAAHLHDAEITGNMMEEHDHSAHSDTTMAHHRDSKIPSIMGIVGSGISLATVGTRTILMKGYTKKMNHRKAGIQEQVDKILVALHRNTSDVTAISDLEALIGKTATQEFVALFALLYKN